MANSSRTINQQFQIVKFTYNTSLQSQVYFKRTDYKYGILLHLLVLFQLTFVHICEKKKLQFFSMPLKQHDWPTKTLLLGTEPLQRLSFVLHLVK